MQQYLVEARNGEPCVFFALSGVSSTAPAAIQRRTRSISSALSGFAFFGMSASPSMGVISSTNGLSSGLPGTIAGDSLLPPASRRSNEVISYLPPCLAGWWQPWQRAWKSGRTSRQ